MATSTNNKQILLKVMLPICALGFLAYFQTLFVPFYLDDIPNLVENSIIKDVGHIGLIWTHSGASPLAYLTFAINFYLGGLEVFGYHFFNLLIHIFASIFVYFLTREIFETPTIKASMNQTNPHWMALGASLIFLIHPVQTQAVTYISQRTTSLATALYLFSVFCYLRARVTGKFIFSLAAFIGTVAAMSTKEIAFTIPFTMLLCEFIFLDLSMKGLRARLLRFIPFLFTLAIVPLYLFLRLMFLGKESGSFNLMLSEMSKISSLDYLRTQFVVIWKYIGLLILPIGQNLDHAHPFVHAWTLSTLVSLTSIVSLFLFAVWLIRRQPILGFCILWFFLTLSVESSMIPLREAMAEHRLYLPMFGFSLFLSNGSYLLLKETKRWLVFMAVVVIVFSTFTILRNNIWRDEFSMWQDVVSKSPSSARGLTNLALVYQKRGDKEQARNLHEKAIEVNPDYFKSYYNLGALYQEEQNYKKATQYYWETVKRETNYTRAYNDLAVSYGAQGDLSRKIELLTRTLRTNPNDDQVHYNLGFAYQEQMKWKNAARHFEKAIELNSRHTKAYGGLGAVYLAENEYNLAIKMLRKALELNPQYKLAYKDLAIAFSRQGNHTKAIETLRTGLNMIPQDPDLEYVLSELTTQD
jgi:protein O-mannosyl-transferase